ncbi:MAG: helix-turn-helix transcriptional regulator [Microscillaceae bacterium]|nr:helix-turn-helix transcriptional regulator [Microscillaceae bacterium]
MKILDDILALYQDDFNPEAIQALILELIRQKRKALQLTQADLAARLQMLQSNYSYLENGKTELSLTRFLQIALILHLHDDPVEIAAPEPSKNLLLEQMKAELRQEFVSKAQVKEWLASL